MRHLKLPYALRQLAVVDYFVMVGSNLPNDLLLVIPSRRTTQFSCMGRRSAFCWSLFRTVLSAKSSQDTSHVALRAGMEGRDACHIAICPSLSSV